MPSIEILDTGWIDRRDSAFPQAVQLPNGDILCSFNVGGGPNVHGGTDWARSIDGGVTWTLEGTILPLTTSPDTTSALKLSRSVDSETVFAYGSRSYRQPEEKFGEGRNEPVLCRSTDGGHTWSAPQVVPMPADCPLEISHGALPLASGRLLAPAATLPSQARLGEQVLLAISDDSGQTWHQHTVAFQDPNGKHGYFEQKFTEIAPDLVMGVCWTVTLGDVADQPDSFRAFTRWRDYMESTAFDRHPRADHDPHPAWQRSVIGTLQSALRRAGYRDVSGNVHRRSVDPPLRGYIVQRRNNTPATGGYRLGCRGAV